MTVQIVGKDLAEVKRITCGNCASVLEYVQSDRRQDYSTDYTGGRDFYNYIQCPCCVKQVRVR